MKILILAQSRSGSTTLFNAIKNTKKIPTLWEPFHYVEEHNVSKKEQQFNTVVNSPNILVKIIDNHFYNYDKILNHRDFTKFFDKVIGLTRENDDDNARSYYAAYRDRNWMDYTAKKSQIDASSEKYKRMLKHSKTIKEEILSFDIFQVTYEGLYIRKDQIQSLEDYLGFTIKDKIDFFK